MKFTEEKLEQLANDMNDLYRKCEDIVYYINKEVKRIEKDLIDKGEITRWQFDCVYIDNPFEEDYVRLFGDDNDYCVRGNELHVNGETVDIEMNGGENVDFYIPYKWLSLDGEELNDELNKFINERVSARLETLREYKEKQRKLELEKAKEVIWTLSAEEAIELIKKHSNSNKS